MSIAEETGRQWRNLREPLQRGKDKWVRVKVKFTALGGRKLHYTVEIYLGMHDRMEESNTKLPSAGTRIIVEVNRNG
jgi:hypothetical protein